MTVTTNKQSILEKPIITSLVINWELVLYTLIFVLAVITRLYDLGARVMSHDESLHALFSFKLYNGEGYTHDPLMHGPLQFHLVAFSYLLFGDNDFSARIPAALFGIALVITPYWLRNWLGKVGAIVTSIGLLISPMLLYYSRYIRNEAFIAFFTAMLAVSLFQYMHKRQQRWLYIGAISVALSMTSKEVALIHGFIGVVFILGTYLWENIPAKIFQTAWYMLGLLTSLLLLGAVLLNGAGAEAIDANIDTADLAGILLMITGLLAGVFTIAINTDRINKPLTQTIQHLISNSTTLIGPVVVSVLLFFLFHMTFLTNIQGAVSGTYGAVTYWLNQQEVARGGQPGYYYLLLMPLYEFLPFLLGGIGGFIYLFTKAPTHGDEVETIQPRKTKKGKKKQIVETDVFSTDSQFDNQSIFPSDGGTFAAYLIFWTISSFVIYSWAGEKMPWLTVHITLPFIFLLGHVSQSVLNNFEWRLLKTQQGLLYVSLLPLLFVASYVLISTQPFQGQSIQNIAATSQFMLVAIITVAIIAGLIVLALNLKFSQLKSLSYLVVLTILSILTIRFAWLSNYVYFDYVNEFLVYAHGAPDVKWVLDEIDDISRRTDGEKQIKVAYGGVIWPLEWYMREYPNRAFFGSNPNRSSLDAPVVIFSPDSAVSLDQVEPYLGEDYERYDYRQVWWPIEDYKNLTWTRIWHNYFVPESASSETFVSDEILMTQKNAIKENRKWLWEVFFYRKFNNHTFKEWPFRTQMYFYVRKDIINDLWTYQTGNVIVDSTLGDPYADKRLELEAAMVWGSNGIGDGQFLNPRAIAISPDGKIYVADSGNHRIQVFDQAGTHLQTWGGEEGAGPGQFSEPWGIAIGEEGKVYVSDTWNHRIEIFSPDGEYLGEFGTFADTQGKSDVSPGSFWGPRDILVDADNNLYISDTGNKRIQKFSPDGEFLGMWGGGGVTEGRFEEPVGLAMDSENNIYVVDMWNQRIQKFDSEFNFILEWPVLEAWESQFAAHKAFITVDNEDRVFISDPENYRIIVYSNTGELLNTFGRFGQEVQSFKLPLDLAFDTDNNLFVVDSENNRIMRFEYP